MPALRLAAAGLPDTPPVHLSVDGMTPAGPNLSHWPGNRTPPEWKADLSTTICLRFARADRRAREAFLRGVEVVLNDHYDTDGFLSLLAVLRPEVLLAREELALLAAATGDFGTFQTRKAFAIDRIVANLAEDESPLREQFGDLTGPALTLARYRWLIDHAESVLDRPGTFAPLWEEDLAKTLEELDRARLGALQRELRHDVSLSVLGSPAPLRRMTLNTLAGAYRVLHVHETPAGPCYRYHDRTESWFELVTIAPPPRRDLGPLRERLQDLEGDHGPAQWVADPPDEPIPELYFGVPAEQGYGEDTRTPAPSRLPREVVERCFVEFFAARDE